MAYNLEYIDIILLIMIAAFVLLRLRRVLGRKSGHESKSLNKFKEQILGKENNILSSPLKVNVKEDLSEESKKHFLQGASQAYETIISSFAKGDKSTLKSLLDQNMFQDFSKSIDERNAKKIVSEITFIGVRSIKIKKFSRKDNTYSMTVDFVSEVITCLKDKNNKIIEGNPDIIKTVRDCWRFSKNMWSHNPTWYLSETLT